jgi:DtxR family Mn-dependent transcriptional regulator
MNSKNTVSQSSSQFTRLPGTANQTPTRMTESLEDYLEMVGFLSDDGNVRVTDIASRLGVSKPSVITALKTLKEQELIEHKRYQNVTLTKKGAQKAAEIRKRHQFLTDFLTDVVGVEQTTAERDACKMEHVLSPETMKKMKVLAGNFAGKHGKTAH